ncbi:hypothetical protein M2103_000619 [Ereboglobus sp. PH5-5]|uniref:PD-(D/E)XK motif protein n=1 Tax=Ereboglobus sp. PH5-5 TaxID=2940529 RepID=UPI002406B9D6|nr:PD-(D/E)XK motif protein [Ereboglobus sp. PH5-5]MDF9832409.1 hypothetical protein [Ereboglobus sp. PH5-5]
MNNPWNNIETPTHEFNVRLVSGTHPLRLYWGKDIRGGYLFIAEISHDAAPDKKTLPELAGIRVALAKAADCERLVLLLNETANWEIFKALCVDLIRASETAKNDAEAIAIIIRRLVRWHEFLKRERLHLLSPEAVKGLIGELLFLEGRLAPCFGWNDAISFWKGPSGSPQDFAVHDMAIEVKCQSGISKPYIQISSLEQMAAQLPEFYLVVQTLATAEPCNTEGVTLCRLVERIRNALARANDSTREHFESLLFQVGYVQMDAYDETRFRCVATRSFKVTNGFPRLTPTNVPEGIPKISYQISLESCAPFECELTLNHGEQT